MLSRHADLFKADALDYLNYNWRSLVGQDCEDFLLNTTRTSIGDIYGLGEELFYVVRFRYLRLRDDILSLKFPIVQALIMISIQLSIVVLRISKGLFLSMNTLFRQ